MLLAGLSDRPSGQIGDRGAPPMRAYLADIALLAMESLVLFMLAATLASGAGGDGPWFVTVFGAMLGGFFLVRLLTHFEAGTRALIGAGAVLSVLALVLLLSVQYPPAGGTP